MLTPGSTGLASLTHSISESLPRWFLWFLSRVRRRRGRVVSMVIMRTFVRGSERFYFNNGGISSFSWSSLCFSSFSSFSIFIRSSIAL